MTLKYWIEEFKEGYYIEYDARKPLKYSYVTPKGATRGLATYEKAYALAVDDRVVYGIKIDLSLPYPLKNSGGKWTISKVKHGKYAGRTVCSMVEWSDGWVLIESGSESDEEESMLDIIRKVDMEY